MSVVPMAMFFYYIRTYEVESVCRKIREKRRRRGENMNEKMPDRPPIVIAVDGVKEYLEENRRKI